ncbi:MAG TPA: hypothetical protein PLJ78_10955 [Anaerolineae bacterium]|nr:hypothetical protein [Anaerolineae bacterium]HQK14446.1 hypothetical protein [Anaerolineae bacterium]
MTKDSTTRTKQEITSIQRSLRYYRKKTGELRQENQQLKEELAQYKARKQQCEEQQQCLQAKLAQLEEKLQRTEQERQSGLIALENERERLRREREGWLMMLLRKMGEGRPFILDMVESLTESEPGWTPQAILTELRHWIQDVSAQRLSRFPDTKEAPGGLIVLTASKLTDPHNGFDVGNERPFESGQAQVTFKVIRRGWRLGTEVLHPARISTFTTDRLDLQVSEP